MLASGACRGLVILLGYVYPAYKCFKALERKKPEGVRAWCEYWCVLQSGCSRPPTNHGTAKPCSGRRRAVLIPLVILNHIMPSMDCPRRLVLGIFTVLEQVGDQTVFW